MAILEVKNLCKRFGDTEVLKGINFSMQKGEVLVIIGSSGSGKTTLLRCLNFLEKADSGQILVNNEVLYDAQDFKRKNSANLRKERLHFGLVFQSFNLFPHMNAIRNIQLAADLLAKDDLKKEYKLLAESGLKGKELKLAKRKAKEEKLLAISQKAQQLLDRVGLGDRATAYPCELSGGQQQRIAIARALALSPDILCFDEPTSALDPELTGEVLKVIKSLKSADNTMIIVTHEMEFARKVGDKIIFMANGIIEEIGTPEEVFSQTKSPITKAFLQKSTEND